jgi:metal-dependent amidase/aminoacylase/carboxypeptidase family protein
MQNKRIFSKGEGTTAAVGDQRNLNTMTCTADMAAELENDWRENVRKLSQAHDVSARTVYAALMRMTKLSKKSARWVKKWFSLEMKKGQFRMGEAAEAMAAAIL